MKHVIEIKPREEGGPGIHFLLDGSDISKHLSGYSIHHDANKSFVPVVQLDLYGPGYAALLEKAEVALEPELAEVLVKLGWKPPTVGDAA